MTPTEEQLEIISAVSKLPSSLMISAYAGTAKTTTLQLAAPGIRSQALALAFNKKISEELKGRLPPHFMIKTLNGLGHSAWASSINCSIKLDDRKLGKLVSQVAKDSKTTLTPDQWDELRRLVSSAMSAGISPGDIGNPLREDSQEAWEDLSSYQGAEFLQIYYLAREVLKEDIRLAQQGIISFDDQIYCPTILGGKWNKYSTVFIDESQDLSPLNHRQLALSSKEGGRIIAVGDPKQCLPPGTKIMLSGGGDKNIEDIEVGDKVVSYNRKVGFSGLNTQGVRVEDKKIFNFKGKLVKIQTDELYAHECTPNHKCMIRWTDKQGYSIYLMQKGNNFRIGSAQNFYWSDNKEKTGFGPTMRARQEGADALWILDTFETKEQALIKEKVIWTLFGLPDLIFKCSGRLSSTQEHLDKAWKEIGDNGDRAKQCLKYFGREYNYPFWIKSNHAKIGSERTTITEACNIISGYMSVMTIDKNWSKCWISYEEYDGPVIGLTVGSNGYGLNLYIANGVVTHNSIYAFRGADSSSMQNMRGLSKDWTDLQLTMTFRCPKVIVNRQQSHAPGYKAWDGCSEGQAFSVEELHTNLGTFDDEARNYWNINDILNIKGLDKLDGKIAILCRNNAPLLSLAFKLLRRNIGCHMLGREIGRGLENLSQKLASDDSIPIVQFTSKLQNWESHECSLARANNKPDKESRIIDQAECLRAVIDGSGARTAGDLRGALQKLFSRDSGLITLSSIHRAKGLEWDLVVHLDPWRIPPKRSLRDPVQLEQEKNLLYVCETRTRHTLLNLNLEDFR